MPEVVQRQDYHAFWHCCKGYSGVSLQLRKDTFADVPGYSHPPFDLESRVVAADIGSLVIASIYVPNGGKDFPAKLAFLTRLIEWAGSCRRRTRADSLRRPEHRAQRDGRTSAKERKPNAVGQLPEERAMFERLLGTGLADMGRAMDPDNAGLFTWWAPWRNLRARNIGWRLDYLLALPASSREHRNRGAGQRGHQRSCPGGDDLTAAQPRTTRAEIAAAAGKTVPDLIAPELRVLFCGINPGLSPAPRDIISHAPATASGPRSGRPASRPSWCRPGRSAACWTTGSA